LTRMVMLHQTMHN